jgi:signal transduction histidine kinase
MPEPKLKSSRRSNPRLGRFFLTKYAQIAYAVILLLVIPGIIIGNTLFVIRKFQSDTDLQLQRQALLIGELVNATIVRSASDLAQTQEKLSAVYQGSPEIQSIELLTPVTDGFRIVASPITSNVGETISTVNAALAWARDEAIAHRSKPSAAEIRADESLRQERYWNVVMPLHNSDGEKIGLLNLRMPLRFVDELTRETLIGSYLLLSATLFLVVLLLFLNTRLFQESILFRKLQEVDEMKDEFISIASHELRTPITAIRGYTSMFLDGSFGQLSEQGVQGLKIIDTSTRRLADLVEDLLNVSRIEQGRLEVELGPTPLAELIRETVAELSITAQQKGLALTFVAEQSPSVLADRDRLKQVLVNLVGNAIKYTPHGSVTISLRDDGETITTKIKDTGIGIASKDRERLFTKFYRVQNEATHDIVGTGLGLWITKQIVELMKGEIAIDSMENVGTELSITLKKASGS